MPHGRVGFLVTFIREDELLKMTAAGESFLQVIPAARWRLMVHGLVPGVIGAKPIHLLDERRQQCRQDRIRYWRFQRGAAALVSPGDRVVFRSVWDEPWTLKARLTTVPASPMVTDEKDRNMI
ncbi:MAG: hypothetical protein ACLSB9_28895 [Hydrogeniiclostridium mannosilyticum]